MSWKIIEPIPVAEITSVLHVQDSLYSPQRSILTIRGLKVKQVARRGDFIALPLHNSRWPLKIDQVSVKSYISLLVDVPDEQYRLGWQTYLLSHPLLFSYRVSKKYPCPCCLYFTLREEPPGTFEICSICSWEDDHTQFQEPDYRGGANHESLNEARAEFELQMESRDLSSMRISSSIFDKLRE